MSATAFRAALVLLSILFAALPASAQSFETKASEALMIDADTGTILFSKNAGKPIAPASLAKLMTMEVVFHALKEGRNTLSDTFPVSENAWRTGGAPSGTSTMFAALKSSISLGDLIQGVIVQSANDGCIIIAEGFAGSEEAFAKQMNERAKAIGLKASVFRNSTGLPVEGQVVTVGDLAQLARYVQREYPELYRYYAQPDFTWNRITQRNRNPLLAMGIGADGVGIGFTEGAGYAIVGSIARDGRRVIVAMSGTASDKERADEARKLLDWGLSAFQKTNIFASDEIVGEVSVYGGAQGTVALKARNPIAAFTPTDNNEAVSARIVYDGPVVAPVDAGTRIGELQLYVGDLLSQKTPLYAAEAVPVGPIHRRAFDAVGELLTGWMR